VIEVVAKISSKNQISIPAQIRKALGVGALDKVAFVISDDGTVELRQPTYTLESVLGSIKGIPGESLDLDSEIEKAVSEEIERKSHAMQKA